MNKIDYIRDYDEVKDYLSSLKLSKIEMATLALTVSRGMIKNEMTKYINEDRVKELETLGILYRDITLENHVNYYVNQRFIDQIANSFIQGFNKDDNQLKWNNF